MYSKKKSKNRIQTLFSENKKRYVSTLLEPFYCSIPEEQKPINLYIEAKENPGFSFLAKFFFIKKKEGNFLNFYFLFILIKLYSDVFILLFLIEVSFMYIFIIWINLSKNFKSAKIFYEESSWFDGQYWEKKYFLIKNDMLIHNQKIKPIMKNLIKKILFFGFLIYFNQLI
jgi:hypothetical protein